MRASKMIKREEFVLDFSEQFPEMPKEEVTLNLTVEPSRLTPAMEAELRAGEESSALLVHFLTTVVIDWDLLDDAGEKVPLTEEGLKDVPIMLLGMIVNEIGDAIAAKTSAEGKP